MAAAMLFSLHKNQFHNRSITVLTYKFDLKGGKAVEKNAGKTCGNTEKAAGNPVRDLEIWARGMQRQGDLARKAANAAELAMTFWWAMTDAQRQELAKSDSVRYAIGQLVGHGYSWA